MGRYTEAALRAAQIVEQQAGQLPCIVPANNLLYCFLDQVRHLHIALLKPGEEPREKFVGNLKLALNSLTEYPLRVYDAATAMEVKGIGSILANIIREELFSRFPPDIPTGHELEQYQKALKSLKNAAAAKAKRKRDADTDVADCNGLVRPGSSNFPSSKEPTVTVTQGPRRSRKPVPPGLSPTGTGIVPDSNPNIVGNTTTNTNSTTKIRSEGAKSKKSYVPGMGTANYAFLITLFKAQQGPERLEFLKKQELMDRAEASGLSNKPIYGDGGGGGGGTTRGGFRGRGGPRNFYNGYSCLNTMINHGLVMKFSNPVKVKLTYEGLGLAERLYRDAVARGKITEEPGLPAHGPWKFQPDHDDDDDDDDDVNTKNTNENDFLNPLDIPLSQRVRSSLLAVEQNSGAAQRIASSQPQRQQPQHPQQQQNLYSVQNRGSTPSMPRISDEHVAMMVEMGFTDVKARKALRRSLDGGLEEALDIVTIISSDDEEPQPQMHTTMPGTSNTNENQVRTQGHIRTGLSNPVSRPRLVDSQIDLALSQSQSQGMYNVYDNENPAFPSRNGQSTKSNVANTSEDINPMSWFVGNESNPVRLPPLTPGRKFEDEYEILLLIDGREQYTRANTGTTSRSEALQVHVSRMENSGVSVMIRTLPIGDALWVARSRRTPAVEYVLDYILERKSLLDLLQSIRDSNRYTSQKYFLKRCGLRNLYYLIEGDIDTSIPEPRDAKTLKTAAASTEIIDGFQVLRTKGPQDTFRMYQSMTQALVDLYRNQTSRSNNNTLPHHHRQQREQQQQQLHGGLMTFDAFKDHMKQVNQGGVTLHDAWGRMLCCVPGLGPDGVAAILAKYPTPMSLWTAYRHALSRNNNNGGGGGTGEAEGLLVGLKLGMTGRAIGPDKSKKVYQSLFMNNWMNGS